MRRPLPTFVESQTREAPERRVCEAREYYITTRMQSGQTVSLLREAFRYWGRRKEIWADSEGVKVETENEGTFLASFLPFFPIRPRIRATLRCPNAWRCLTVRIFSVSTQEP